MGAGGTPEDHLDGQPDPLAPPRSTVLRFSVHMPAKLSVGLPPQGPPMTPPRSDVVLAAMVPAPRDVWFDPVRAQKLLFLIDMEIPTLVGGPHFNFQPYNYGPFDVDVYLELEALTTDSYVHTDRAWRHLRYKLTEKGVARGTAALASIPDRASRFIERACEWMLAASFSDLLSAIYRQYPEMTVNTLVPQLIPKPSRPKKHSAATAFLTGLARSMDYMGLLDERPAGTDSRVRDQEAIGNDWRRTGNDLRIAMEKCASQGVVDGRNA